MYNGMPPLVPQANSDTSMEYDLVTGAPRPRRPAYYPVQSFLPPAGYNYQGYIGSQYLAASPQPAPASLPPSPSLSPNLVPVAAGWTTAYRDIYGGITPNQAPGLVLYPDNAAQRYQVPLVNTSPQVSPYANMIALPAISGENYENTQQTWAGRLMSWINSQGANDPHRQFVQDILIHESLDRKRSGIRWNIAYPPHTILVNHAPDPHASAFSPELASCRIVSPLLPWAIEVKAHAPYTYITVLSLLGDIYKALNKPIERSLYESVPPLFRAEVDKTFNERCMSIPDDEAASNIWSQGIKRADFLLNKRFFVGLTQIKNLMYTFELKVSSRPS